jgi:Holliday junction resolvasome RuvABC endonuclease subunit
MKALRVAAIDPSLTHFGIAKLILKLETMQFGILSLHTIVTESNTKGNKTLRKNSDDLRRCKLIMDTYPKLVADCSVVFAEIPVGAQSARAMFAFGAATMAVAACPVPVIEIQPSETKMATVGTKTASKEEMIEWASAAYPNGPFERYPKDKFVKGKLIRRAGAIVDSEEHVCDAVAVAHAGVRNVQFQQLLALMRATQPQNLAAA